MTEKKAPAFEVECSSMDEFLRMLELRESEEAPGKDSFRVEERSAVRRAVFVAQHQDYRRTQIGLPHVTRYVRAGFAYGEDLVSFKWFAANGIEPPRGTPGAEKPAEKQEEAYGEVSGRIRAKIAGAGLDTFLVEGFLHHAAAERDA